MSKTLKIMFAFMAVLILVLGCALVSVAVTLGQPTTTASAEVYEAPALAEEVEEVEVVEVVEEAAEPAAPSHPLGWSDAEEAEAMAYADKSMRLLDTWLEYLDDAMEYNDRMVADPTLIFDVSWVTGYWFAMSDWINLADECLAWPVPVAPMSDVDYLTKQSCSSWRRSATNMQIGLDGLPDDIDGLIYQLGVAVDELDDANQYMGQANERLDEITVLMGG